MTIEFLTTNPLTQRMDALEHANEVRAERARLKRDLKAGRVDPAGLIATPDDRLLTMRLFDLLMAVPKVGRVRVTRVMDGCRLAPSKTIGGLSDRQRGQVVSWLMRRGL